MDYEERIVKLEVTMDMLKEELTLVRSQITLLDRKIEEFREQSLRRMDDLREHTDALRDHADRRFSEHAGLVQLRRDYARLIYWVAGLTITNVVMITGVVLKAVLG